MTEIWKDINGFEGVYQVSNLSRVKSLDRILYKNNGHDGKFFFKIKGFHLKPHLGKTGYLSVMLSSQLKRKRINIHRLVANGFIPNPNNYPQVNHINGVKTDNRIENLEWCTASHNVCHAFRIGLSKVDGTKLIGNKHRGVIEVLNTNTGIFYDSMKEAAKIFRPKQFVYDKSLSRTRVHKNITKTK